MLEVAGFMLQVSGWQELGVELVDDLAHDADAIQIARGRDLVRDAQDQPGRKQLDQAARARFQDL